MKFAFGSIALLVSLNAFAGGSITREEALTRVASENKDLAQTLVKLDLADVGEAVRAGSQTGASGERFMPFDFTTRDGKSTVEINYDADGKLTATIK